MSDFSDLVSELLKVKKRVDKKRRRLAKQAAAIERKYSPRSEFNRWKVSSDGVAWKRAQYLKQKKKCAQCLQDIPLSGSHIDHIKPLSKYPELALVKGNLRILCPYCNCEKGD